MKSNQVHSGTWRIAVVVVVLFLLVAGFVVVRGSNNPKPTITISLLSEVDLVTNRVATLVLSNSGPGKISMEVGSTNNFVGRLELLTEGGDSDTAYVGFTSQSASSVYRTLVLEPGDTQVFHALVPRSATKWQFVTGGWDPRRGDSIWHSNWQMSVFRVVRRWPLPEDFWGWVRGNSEWTLEIVSPWFGYDPGPTDPD